MPKKAMLAFAAATAVVAGFIAMTAAPGGTTAAAPLDAEEQLFLDLLNQYRQQNGLATVSIDSKLQDAAEWMSTDMGVNRYFSHTDSLGRDPFVRMTAFGYNYNTWKGENIAAGYNSAASVFDAWKNSSGHNANMLNPNYKVVGIGRDDTPASPYNWYWTNDFGGYAPPTPAATPSPAPNSDADGDGFTYAAEVNVGTNPNDPCGNPNTALPGSPSMAWPADLSAASPNRVDVMDVATFVVPVRRFDSAPGDPEYDRRWDVVPGRSGLPKDINITDINAVIRSAPPMFSYQRVFNGPSCTP